MLSKLKAATSSRYDKSQVASENEMKRPKCDHFGILKINRVAAKRAAVVQVSDHKCVNKSLRRFRIEKFPDLANVI